MKKLILIIILIFAGIYYLRNNHNSKDVSVISNGSYNNEIVYVRGKVVNNFKILDKGFYELKDLKNEKSILIISKKTLPKIGEIVTVKLKKDDLMTINDQTYSLYQQVD